MTYFCSVLKKTKLDETVITLECGIWAMINYLVGLILESYMFTHTWLSGKLSAIPCEENTVLCNFRATRKQDMKAFLKKEDCVEEINVQTTKMSLRQKNKWC